MHPVDFLEELVATPSLSRHEHEFSEKLVARMQELGLVAHRDEVGNAIGSRGRGSKTLVLLGHMDTVGGGPEVHRKDGKLYGRGTVDAKGPLAVFVQALARIKMPDDWKVVVIGAVEEEVASSFGARHIVKAYHPEACVIGEPSGSRALTLGYKGYLKVEFERHQPTAHTAGPNPSACDHVFQFCENAFELCHTINGEETRFFHCVHGTIREMHTPHDEQEESARVKMTFRLPPQLSPAQLEARLREFSDPVGHMTTEGGLQAHLGERNSSLVGAFSRTFRNRGWRPRHKVKTGTSDMNVVGPVWRCPIAAYGPGDSSLDHTPDEHIRIEEYLESIDVLSETLEDFMGTHQSVKEKSEASSIEQ